MSTPVERSFWDDFKQFFLRGLAILLPSVLTLWILFQVSMFVFNNVAQPINSGLRAGVLWVMPQLPSKYQPTWFEVRQSELDRKLAELPLDEMTVSQQESARRRAVSTIRHQRLSQFWGENWYLEGTGLVVAIVLIYLAGLLLGGLIGQSIYRRLEQLIARIPGFKQVYPHVKQVVELVIGGAGKEKIAFKRVVLVQWPRPGVFAMGFVTSESMPAIVSVVGERCVTVFIPTTPTPFTGFPMTVPERDLIDLPVSLDEAIRFIMTGGVLVPEGKKLGTKREADRVAIENVSAAMREATAAGSARAHADDSRGLEPDAGHSAAAQKHRA